MRLLSLSLLVLTLFSPLGSAQTHDSTSSNAQDRTLIELFTSQSCSSCPKAEKLFAELADRDDLVVIEWHVDYWNNLVHGRDGRWQDPYSSQANTIRQRDYNLALRGTAGVYTPQAVISGVTETTGSRGAAIENLLSKAPETCAKIEMSYDTAGLAVSIAPTPDVDVMEAEVMLVELIASASNEIHGGENRGLTAHSRNIAISNDSLGAWTGAAETYRARKVDDNRTCAIVVQEKGTGRILGAEYCPTAASMGLDPDESLAPSFTDAHP